MACWPVLRWVFDEKICSSVAHVRMNVERVVATGFDEKNGGDQPWAVNATSIFIF